MAGCIILFSVLFSFLSLLFMSSSCLGSHWHTSSSSSANAVFFVFGDSLFDPGNNNFLPVDVQYRADFPPYGETFFKFPTGRHNDGLLIPDFIAMHANLPPWKPYLSLRPGIQQQFSNGTNFASCGSGVLDDTSVGTLSLRKQSSYFKEVADFLRRELGDEEVNEMLANAIYMCSAGGNDYVGFIQNVPNPTESQVQEFVELVVGNLTNVIKELYELGARKFAFQNVGPMGCLPTDKQYFDLKGTDCYEVLLNTARLHNSALLNVSEQLEGQLPGFQYLIFDYFSVLLERINNPSKYGFKDSINACCGSGAYLGSDCGIGTYELCSDPNEYLFFDGQHPTNRAFSQLAQLLWNGTQNVTKPYNMKQFLELETIVEVSPKDHNLDIY